MRLSARMRERLRLARIARHWFRAADTLRAGGSLRLAELCDWWGTQKLAELCGISWRWE